MPPLLVIQTLAQNSTATLAVVKVTYSFVYMQLPRNVVFQDYIIRRLQQENDAIAEDERLIKQYKEETERTKAHVEALKTKLVLPRCF